MSLNLEYSRLSATLKRKLDQRDLLVIKLRGVKVSKSNQAALELVEAQISALEERLNQLEFQISPNFLGEE